MSLQDALKNKVINDYKNELSKMISDADFKNVFGLDTKIIKYNELKEYKTFYDLMPEPCSFVIVLTESQENSGHWCCLFRTKDDEIYWMDSYGIKPDGELKFIPDSMRRMLGETTNELQRLIKTVPKGKFHYLKKRIQTMKEGINTCGRWTMIFIKLCLMGFSIEEIVEFIESKSKKKCRPPDILAVDWTPA
jgi:hypothetical protein